MSGDAMNINKGNRNERFSSHNKYKHLNIYHKDKNWSSYIGCAGYGWGKDEILILLNDMDNIAIERIWVETLGGIDQRPERLFTFPTVVDFTKDPTLAAGIKSLKIGHLEKVYIPLSIRTPGYPRAMYRFLCWLYHGISLGFYHGVDDPCTGGSFCNTGLKAWVIGDAFGAIQYQNSVMRHLLDGELRRSSKWSNATQFNFKVAPADLKFAYQHTPAGSALRRSVMDGYVWSIGSSKSCAYLNRTFDGFQEILTDINAARSRNPLKNPWENVEDYMVPVEENDDDAVDPAQETEGNELFYKDETADEDD